MSDSDKDEIAVDDRCLSCGCRCEAGPDDCICDVQECLFCEEVGCSEPWLER